MLDVIGTPYSGINLSLSEGALISSADAQIFDRAQGRPRADREATCARCASALSRDVPRRDVLLPRAGHLDAGAQLRARRADRPPGRRPDRQRGEHAGVRASSSRRIASRSPGAVDVHLAQVSTVPELRVDDRPHRGAAGRADRARRRERRAGVAVVERLVSPAYWIDKRGVQYLVAVQTPQYEVDSIDALRAARRSRRRQRQRRRRSATSRASRASTAPANITHYNVARTFDVQANVDGTDLGSVADAIDDDRRDMREHAPPGTHDHRQGPGREHGQLVRRPALRPGVRDPARLPADGRELPVAGSIRSSS